jgi:hypothetical protein
MEHLRWRLTAVLAPFTAKLGCSATESKLAAADIKWAGCHIRVLPALSDCITSTLTTFTAEFGAEATANDRVSR